MRRSVVAGLRVHREDEPDRQHVEEEEEPVGRPAVEARVVGQVAEDEAAVLVMIRDEDEHAEDHEHTQHVPHDRNVVEESQQGVGEDVDARVEDENDQEQHELVVEDRRRVSGREVDAPDVHAVDGEHGIQEDRRAVADAGDDSDEADHVEPAGEPAPARPAELRRPPVRTARSRVRRGQLGHREADEQDEPAEDRPAERDARGPAGRPREREVREDPGEDRDDRERDCKVGETAPRPCQLLSVTQLGEPLFVASDVLPLCHCPSLLVVGASVICNGRHSQPATRISI